MTVKELIAELEKVDPQLEVVIVDSEYSDDTESYMSVYRIVTQPAGEDDDHDSLIIFGR